MNNKHYRIAVLPGEGIGPEVLEASLPVLQKVCALEGISFELEEALIGTPAIEASGEALPENTVRCCREADAILFGAVTQEGILQLRRQFDFYVNLRPIRIMPGLEHLSALRPELTQEVDLLVVRELGSGIYFGPAGTGADERGPFAYHTMRYHDEEIRRIARQALAWASRRSGRLTVAHKENALPRIKWQQLVQEEAKAFANVKVDAMLVDSLAMELIRTPGQFDVILAGNLFGDILSDLGGAITGSLGMLPSASLNDSGFGLYEPVHGTAPNIAGQGIANPLAMIGSMEMMLSQWGYPQAGARLRRAQELALLDGHRTADLKAGKVDRVASTQEMALAVADNLEKVTATKDEKLLQC